MRCFFGLREKKKPAILIVKLDAGFYIKDRQNVYYNGSLLLYSDPETFEVLENSYYAKDANKVYAFGKVLEGVSPDGFDLGEYLER